MFRKYKVYRIEPKIRLSNFIYFFENWPVLSFLK